MRACGACSVLMPLGLVLAASCSGDDSSTPADTSVSTVLESVRAADADELISVLEEIVGPCAAVNSAHRDSRHVGTCTLASGVALEVDVWWLDAAASPSSGDLVRS